MGATYTRQSSYADGDVITAAHTNDEFNQLLAAFQASTGHTHDGTANEGGPITKLLGTSITIGDATSGTDITVTFDGESNDGVLKWMEDEDYFEFSDDILVASTEKIQFRDTAIYINSSTDGQLDLVADTEIQIAATTVDINGAVDISGNLSVGGNLDVTGTFDLSDSNFTNAGNIQLDSISGDSDTNTSITFSGSDVITVATGGTTSFTVDASQNILMSAAQKVQFRDTALTINSSTDGQMDIDADTELEITAPTVDINASTAVLVSNDLKLDSDAAVLGFGADNDVTLTHVADTGLLLNSTMALQFNDASQSINAPSATVLDINATDEIELNATLVDANANLDVSGTYTGGGLMTTGGNIVIPDSGNIGSASDTDAIAIASNGQVTLTQTLIGTALDISGDIDVDGTTNLDVVDIDGAVDMATTLAVAGNVDFNGDLDVDGTTNLDNTDIDGTLVVDGSNISLDSTSTLNIDNSNTTNGITIGTATSGVPVSIGHTTSETTVNDNLTVTGSTTLAATSFGDANITNVGDIALDSISADGTDINIAVTDNSATALTIKQGSDAYLIVDTANSSESVSIGTGISGTAITIGHGTSEVTFGDNVTVTGDFTVNGTTTTVATTNLTVTDPLVKYGQGYTGTAYDQGFIVTRGDGSSSNTANRGFIWDESADEFATIAANTEAGTTAGNVTINDYAPLHVGAITADDNSTFSGEIAAASLDISGDIDVDGTTNLDVVDIDGAVNMATTALVTGVLTTTAATVFNGGFAANADSTVTKGDGTSSLIGARYSNTYRKVGFNANNSTGNSFIAFNSNSVASSANQKYDISSEAARIDFASGVHIDVAASGTAGDVITYVDVADFTTAGTVFNEGSADLDFRVESNGNANMLFVDGGNDQVSIGGAVSETGDTLQVTNAGSSGPTNTRFVNTNDDASGVRVDFMKNTGNAADGDGVVQLNFLGRDSSGNAENYANINVYMEDVTSGTEDGSLAISTIVNGTNRNRLDFLPTETVFNEAGIALNFRVESDDATHALFVDGANDFVAFGKSSDSVATRGSAFSNLQSGGHHYLGICNDDSTSTNSAMYINRETADGDLIVFRQANSTEGTISVSGSTVSYNGFAGRHESSGIATNTAVGTVVSTIDELDVYPNKQPSADGGEMANPKAGQTRADHAKVKVSDAVGDACVYGVVAEFTAQDKVIVRSVGIGSVKVTGACAKGDLLESNGDGTAKVQSDDIIRSKTIGKVTIGNSNTGVKLVSCVLYCG